LNWTYCKPPLEVRGTYTAAPSRSSAKCRKNKGLNGCKETSQSRHAAKDYYGIMTDRQRFVSRPSAGDWSFPSARTGFAESETNGRILRAQRLRRAIEWILALTRYPGTKKGSRKLQLPVSKEP